jgi:sensor histidine kinase YesM
MHPILGDRQRLLVYLVVWQLLGLLLTVGFRQATPWLEAATFFLPLCLIYAFVCLSGWYLCRAFPMNTATNIWNVLLAYAAAAAVASLLWVVSAMGWAMTLGALTLSRPAQLYQDQVLLIFVLGVLLFLLAAACQYMLMAFQASRDAEKRAIELDLLAREAELRALRAQIDPHFIYNSLHSISALTATDPPAARRMCLLLADFLRETLRLGSSTRITLGSELALAERFLAIEQVRLGPRLQIARETDPHAIDCLVPPLLLQPLVENAVVHGIGQLIEGGTIRLAAVRDGQTLRITLDNPCDPDRARTRGVGLGLELLRKRLTTQCGAYDAVHAAEDEGRFRVEVRMPAVTTT